jgi:hypothetical protein
MAECETGIGCGDSGLFHDLGGVLANFLNVFGNPAFAFIFIVVMVVFLVGALTLILGRR